MNTKVAVVAIIENKGRILMGRKAPNVGPYPNTWHIPGGKVNLGSETLEQAIKREIKEETGLEIKKLEHVSFDEDNEPDKNGNMTHYIFLVYKTEVRTEKVTPGDDIVELRWFKKSEIRNFPLTRPSAKYFKKVGLL